MDRKTQEMSDSLLRQIIRSAILVTRPSLGEDAPIPGGADIANDLGFDSIDKVELVMELEDHFKISIDDDEMAEIKTVDDIALAVKKATGVIK